MINDITKGNLGVGALDASNKTLAGTSGIHNRDKVNPIFDDPVSGIPSDFGPGHGLSSQKDYAKQPGQETNLADPEEPFKSARQYMDKTDLGDVKTKTVIGGSGTFGTEVTGGIKTNFGGVEYESR
jgi:hypothetical protein